MIAARRLATTLLLLGAAAPEPGATPPTRAALPLAEVAGRGAATPWDEYEAEDATTDGAVIGPDTRFGTLAAEASGRRAVRLDRPNSRVVITLARPANAVVVRYAVPDTPDGHGRGGTLSLAADGQAVGVLPVNSHYSWFYGRYPFSNRPADGGGHHAFDHARLLLGRTLPAGTRVSIALGTDLPWAVIDLADFELIPPPLTPPPGAVSLTALGADPTGSRDAGEALRRGLALAQRHRRTLWVPAGNFRVDGQVVVDRVTLAGAGLWWSTIRGRGVGLYGRPGPAGSRNVVVRDLSIIGQVDERRDDQALSGIGGALNDSLIERVWLQHHKTGIWVDGPLRRLTVRQARILDMTADGVNFHRGVTGSAVEDTFVRGTGDDGLAAWSGGIADAQIAFRHNTVVAPVLANGIALYGGHDLLVEDNLIADTLTEGGGIHVGNRFGAVPLTGSITIRRNTLVRSGSLDPHWRFGIGALWLYALDHPIRADIRVSDLDIRQPVEEPILLIGRAITGLRLDGVRTSGSGRVLLTTRAPGEVRFGALGPAEERLVRRCGNGKMMELNGFGARHLREKDC